MIRYRIQAVPGGQHQGGQGVPGFIRAPLFSLAMVGLGMAQSVPFNTGEWEPFTSERLPNKGCATELVAAICRAGGIEASFLEEELRKAGIGIEIVNSLDSAARMLRSGRVDFMVDEETVVYHAIHTCFPGESERFKALPNVFWGSTASYLMVSRAYPNAQAILAKSEARDICAHRLRSLWADTGQPRFHRFLPRRSRGRSLLDQPRTRLW